MLKVFFLLIFPILTSAKNILVPTDTKIGTRLQGVMTNDESQARSGNVDSTQDFYLRRTRLQVGLSWDNGWSQYFDIRNDKVNKSNSGEGDFNIGDAFLQKKLTKGKITHKFKFFRAKVDVSRSETVSSSRVLYLNRALSADFAAQYVSHNRRANNVQWNGNYDNRFEWHLVVGDSVQSSDFDDAQGANASSISQDKFMFGGKVRFHIFENKQKKIAETFFDGEDHFSVAVGAFHVPEFQVTANSQTFKEERNLVNAEMTFNYKNFTLMAEYFHFSNINEDFSSANPETSNKSHSYYVQGEYRFTSKWAAVYRYEYWDKAKDKENYDLNHYVLGVNHYIDGNAVRLGAYYDQKEYGRNISSTKNEKSVLLTAMLHFY